ncbi:MAG: GtrA family protein [Clostridia bacterium]|nr:GtrA family protein [Clostridia bacterium]
MIARLKKIMATYREQLLYLVFGALTTLVDFAISFLLYHVWIDTNQSPDAMLHLADVLAWAAAVTFAFITNRIWVFESKQHGFVPVTKELAGFAGGRVFTLLLQEAIMAVFVTWLGWNKYLFRILAAVLVVILNYVISKLFVFKNK